METEEEDKVLTTVSDESASLTGGSLSQSFFMIDQGLVSL